jgi:hypothetical protein
MLSPWKNVINVMLKKDVGGCPRINCLRIIHLFEANFNFFLKLLWGHRLVHRAHDFKMINTWQYGSVPGRTAVELVMLNQMSNNIYQHNITVNISETLCIRYSNKFDCCIMDSDAIRLVNKPGQQSNIKNLVRLHHQVLTLSDLSTSDGTTIREWFLRGRRHLLNKRSGDIGHGSRPQQTPNADSGGSILLQISSATACIGALRSEHPPLSIVQNTLEVLFVWFSIHHRNWDMNVKVSKTTSIACLGGIHVFYHPGNKERPIYRSAWRSFRSRQRIMIASDGGLKSWLGTHGWKIVS